MWRPDAARAHGADSGEAAIELGWTRGKVVRPHAPSTDRQRDQDDKHFDEWGGEPGHGATKGKRHALPWCPFVARCGARLLPGRPQARNRIAVLNRTRAGPLREPALDGPLTFDL